MRHLLFKALILIFIAGCASLPARKEIPAGARIIEGVPLYKQRAYECGPAALASVLGYWQKRAGISNIVTPDEISSEIYSKGARGALGLDLLLYARKRGVTATHYPGGINDLKKKIDEGVPPVILVDFGNILYQANHFITVVGYAGEGIIVHSGTGREFILWEDILKPWGKTGFWTLVIKPSE
ncbi:MAG: C39 family peptidase [Thermodesulfovibrionales bacterium]|nr:C39 family peptidase [Thermodesulfovibrionales bacterium]